MSMKAGTLAPAAAGFLAAALLLAVGGWCVLFGLACYLGGPCPRPGDLHLHLFYGTLWSAVGAGLVWLGWKTGRWAWRRARPTAPAPAPDRADED